MLYDDKITEIYYMADDFCNFFSDSVKKHTIEVNDGERNMPSRMSDAEIITIMMMFLSSGQCTQLNPQSHRRHSCILPLP